jgi:serine/threonine protein kinase
MAIDPKRVKEIFLEAAELPDGAARTAYLDRACGTDAVLRARVEALLQSHDPDGSFLGTPAAVLSYPDQAERQTSGANADPGPEPGADHTATDTLSGSSDAGSAGRGSTGVVTDDEALTILAPPRRPDSLGRIGHYEVLQVLGRGGFGIVFRAFDVTLQRVVAVKVMAPQLAATSPARKRFLREARSSAQVRHENVVQVYEVAEQPLPYLVMEFIPGETLQQKLDRVGPLDVPEVLQIGRQIAEGLDAAHAKDLIHRDIKPANVLLEGGQQKVKITDFGLARAADDGSISQSGVIAGTPMYMAPEQALGQPLDQRADLFSLGSVLYQMVAGRPPFRANSALAVLKRVAEDKPRSIREIIPETPQWLCDIIAKLHAKEPDERYQSAREVADVLADCAAQLQAGAKLKDYSRIPRDKSRSAGRWKWAAAAAGLLAALPLSELAGWTHLFWGKERPAARVTPPVDPGPKVVAEITPKSEPPAEPNPKTEPPAEPKSPPPAIAPFSDADVRRIAALPVAKQIEEVRKELIRRNPGFDGAASHKIEDGAVTEFNVLTDKISDISPVRAFPKLEVLACYGAGPTGGTLADLAQLRGLRLRKLAAFHNWKITDLRPLVGMPLQELNVWGWRGTDLTPLKGMPLKSLNIGGGYQYLDLAPLAELPLESLVVNYTQVSDLTPVRGMPLTEMSCENTPVSDLSPLRGKRLQQLYLVNTPVSDLSVIRGMRLTVLRINGTTVPDLSLLKDLPLQDLTCDLKSSGDVAIVRSIKTLRTINDKPVAEFWKEFGPLTDGDVRRIAGLPPEQQVEEVRKELVRHNPGFDGKAEHATEGGVVTEFRIVTDHVTDVAPIRVFNALRVLECRGTHTDQSNGLLADLTPLKGMNFASLKYLNLGDTRVSDEGLIPFKDCRALTRLSLAGTKVGDPGLARFKGTPLTALWIQDTGVTDLTPLQGMPLEEVRLTPKNITRGLDILRGIKNLKTVGVTPYQSWPAAEFWQRYDKGEFK